MDFYTQVWTQENILCGRKRSHKDLKNNLIDTWCPWKCVQWSYIEISNFLLSLSHYKYMKTYNTTIISHLFKCLIFQAFSERKHTPTFFIIFHGPIYWVCYYSLTFSYNTWVKLDLQNYLLFTWNILKSFFVLKIN